MCIRDSYTFRLVSDDGSRLFVDGSLLIGNDGIQGPTVKDGIKNLKAGRYPLVLEYFQAGRGITLALQWQIPGAAEFKTIGPLSFETR